MDETTTPETDASDPAPSLALPPRPFTERTRIRRHAERAVPARVEEFLRAGYVAHVAYVADGEPRVIPFLYHYEPGRLILHGAPGSSTLAALRDGTAVAIAVSMIDALIASKDAEDHSANYRSVVAYGRSCRITDLDEKRRLLEAMTERYFPGRQVGVDYAPATETQLKALEVVAVEIDEAQAKMREGGPRGRLDDDPDAPGLSFVKPL